jgi:CheY-like chemotaxis protein
MSSDQANALFLTGDLVFASKVQASAGRTGKRLAVVMSAAALLERMAEGPRLVLIDLTAPGLDVRDLVARLRAFEHPPAVVAYAPHVHEQTLAAAVQAGCDEVLTRGQFNSQLDGILERHLAP